MTVALEALPHGWFCGALADFLAGDDFHSERVGFASHAARANDLVVVASRDRKGEHRRAGIAGAALRAGDLVCVRYVPTDIVDGNDPLGRTVREPRVFPVYGA